jgi:DNA-binding transcriptional LysR family regulator
MQKRRIDWETQVGRRLRLRDLHAFLAVTRAGSMIKAAQELGVSQPAISKVIADLEHALGVRLLDRSRNGVEPTIYGQALIQRSTAAFDELKQSVRDIESLSDPTSGHVRLACAESVAAVLPPIIDAFCRRYPRATLDVDHEDFSTFAERLRDRSLDLALPRLPKWPSASAFDDLKFDILFEDELVIVAGRQSRWARRRKIDVAELIDEDWILTVPDTHNFAVVAEAFHARGLGMPKVSVRTLSVHLRTKMACGGRFITTLPRSIMRLYGDLSSLKVLPVDLPPRPWPVAIVTLKNRTLSPAVERFIECTRQFTKPIVGRPKDQASRRSISNVC